MSQIELFDTETGPLDGATDGSVEAQSEANSFPKNGRHAWRDRRPLYSEYEALERRYGLRYVGPELGQLFSFAGNTQRQVHSWYAFKEGFSHDLVGLFINEFHVPRGEGLVVDPFSGSGTTVLEATMQGRLAFGIEINPFFANVASTKLHWRDVDPAKAGPVIDRILASAQVTGDEIAPPTLTSFSRLYAPEVLGELLRLKREVEQATTEDQATRRFLQLGLTGILELTSRAYKTGKGLKFRRRQEIAGPAEVREKARARWLHMLADLTTLHVPGVGSGAVIMGDARNLPLEDASAHLIVYSPPYANTFDYNEVYKLEMWFLDYVASYSEWRKAKESTVRSHVSLKIPSGAQSDSLVDQALDFLEDAKSREAHMLRAYFSDMNDALAEQTRVVKKGGHVVIVVGNSSYGCVPIATDLILARLAESAGFKVREIRVGRRLNTSSQQMKLYGEKDQKGLAFMRESAVILER